MEKIVKWRYYSKYMFVIAYWTVTESNLFVFTEEVLRQ